MTVPVIDSSYYQKVWIFAKAGADMSESLMTVGMITAIVNCALGEAWKHNFLLGGIGFVATIGFGRCARRAEELGGLVHHMIQVYPDFSSNRINAEITRYMST